MCEMYMITKYSNNTDFTRQQSKDTLIPIAFWEGKTSDKSKCIEDIVAK